MSEIPAPDSLDLPAIDEKWRRIWAERGVDSVDMDAPKRPFYNLMMFPYPSAEKLHVGNAYAFTGADIFGRYRRLKGDDVFEPMGFDAFGIHSENYALKVGRHPAELTAKNVEYFREQQLKKLGLMLNWEHEVDTTRPEYYRWTQWLFLELFKAGLAEHREGPVKWCPSDKTVLADEQVIDGRCERCDSVVEVRFLKQWFLKITKYAQQLLDALDGLDWSEKTKTAQRNWIGRSEGAFVTFGLEGCARESVTVFTTRPDTLYGATFLVVGADHPRLREFVGAAQRDALEAWTPTLPGPGAEPDFSIGIDLGSVALHPLTGERIPVYAAPYVLGAYGTGAIMAVPAHDERDHAFARAHNLPIVQVITGGDAPINEAAYIGAGVMMNSADLDGSSSEDGKRAVVDLLKARNAGEQTVQYKLRDWLISRQRYWGPPIPIIHCPVDGPVAVPVADLPVELPDVEDFRPLGSGESPLATVADWVNVTCPTCGGAARRETDVSDNFLDSAWYFLRYPSTDFADKPLDAARTTTWLPVNMYIGGNEHAVLHLMYARFVMRALYDLGHVPSPEPFTKFRAHGLLIKDGAKMSKSKGNVINPDEYVARYGADVFRMYLMFLGPYTDGGDFRDDGMRGITRFTERVWRVAKVATGTDTTDETRERRRHQLIAAVDNEIASLGYNKAIALLMEFVRELDHEKAAARTIDVKTLTQLMAPFAPHLADELWERLGGEKSVHRTLWPEHDEALAAAATVTIAVQMNGKLRTSFDVPAGTTPAELETTALALPRVQELLGGTAPRKVIAVMDRIVNIVA